MHVQVLNDDIYLFIKIELQIFWMKKFHFHYWSTTYGNSMFDFWVNWHPIVASFNLTLFVLKRMYSNMISQNMKSIGKPAAIWLWKNLQIWKYFSCYSIVIIVYYLVGLNAVELFQMSCCICNKIKTKIDMFSQVQ